MPDLLHVVATREEGRNSTRTTKTSRFGSLDNAQPRDFHQSVPGPNNPGFSHAHWETVSSTENTSVTTFAFRQSPQETVPAEYPEPLTKRWDNEEYHSLESHSGLNADCTTLTAMPTHAQIIESGHHNGAFLYTRYCYPEPDAQSLIYRIQNSPGYYFGWILNCLGGHKDDRDSLCPVCGKVVRSMAQHIRVTHGFHLSCEFGLNEKRNLFTELRSDRLVAFLFYFLAVNSIRPLRINGDMCARALVAAGQLVEFETAYATWIPPWLAGLAAPAVEPRNVLPDPEQSYPCLLELFKENALALLARSHFCGCGKKFSGSKSLKEHLAQKLTSKCIPAYSLTIGDA